ncbi:MAG: dihydrodipicolinate synthase family protein [Methanoregulaceae archaeon]|nr:dihydrodipicolinate synthase family protein [Methanoregulaceae archaeon]
MVLPASITPFNERGRIDELSVAKLLAHFESTGCDGVVLGGTNGEGPSLSAVEKRDLLEIASGVSGTLKLILGTNSSSIDENIWLSKQAARFGAMAMLVMPPSYFREASQDGIVAWFRMLLDASPVPIIAYHFPKRTGVPLLPEMMAQLADHPNLLGLKDGSGEETHAAYRAVLPSHRLFVGDERQLLKALLAGWTGTISGVANCLSRELVAVLRDWPSERESAETKFALLLPEIERMRAMSQPMAHKRFLAERGIIARDDVRLPLQQERG